MTLCSPLSSLALLHHHNYSLLLDFEPQPCTQQFLTDYAMQLRSSPANLLQQIWMRLKLEASKLKLLSCMVYRHGQVKPKHAQSSIVYIQSTMTYYVQSLYTTYQQSSSGQQGLDSTHSQCTQLSFPSLEPDLGHSCRTLLNHLLCQCSLSQIHSVGYQVDHSRLKEDLK